ncbi:MAG: molybdopterin molybdotransferase MoeA [Rhodoferax sp.]|nr:molybdopterin molybdotransferase MoeA [Rhodoferax sp.]
MPRQALLSLDQALSDLLAHAKALTGVETIPVMEADGRVLAQDLVSQLQVPPHDNSAMDGYAVRCADLSQVGDLLPVTQRIAAGAWGEALQPGSAARIFTGAPVPAGADAVLMQEDCTAIEASGAVSTAATDGTPTPGPLIRVAVLPTLGQHIRRSGEDVTRGAVVLPRGKRLGPAELGLAASIGSDKLDVVKRPRVALFSTGDELIMPGSVAPADMPPGAIYNSNRFFLHALLRRMGCAVTDLGIVPDQRAATIAALQSAALSHDVILTSGGVSVGEEDHVKPAVQALGTLDLWQIAIKPGKPFAYGRVADCHFLGLPGNPVSSFMTFLLLVRPFLLRLQGIIDTAMQSYALRADFAWPKADKRREFLRVRRNAVGGLELFANQSSGVLTSAVWGDGVVDNPPGCAISPGDTVRFIAFSEWLA